MSIRLRLTLWYSGILAVTLMIFGIGLYFFLHFYVYDDLEKGLRDQVDRVYSRIQFNFTLNLKGSLNLDLVPEDRDFRSTGTYLQVVNFTNGTIKQSDNLLRSQLSLPPVTEKTRKLAEENPIFYEKSTIEGYHFLIYNKRLIVKDQEGQQVVGLLQGATMVESFDKFFDTLQYILSIFILLTILLAASIGWFLARKALKPIDQVIEAANQIEKGVDLNRRILYDGPGDEIGRLIDTINGMLSRIQVVYSELEEAYRAQRRFVSDASHELRTPLTTIRGNVDLLEKMWKQAEGNLQLADSNQMEMSLEAMQDIAAEAQRMSRLINDLLSLARADAGLQVSKEPIEIKPLVEEVIRRAQFLKKKAEWLAGDLSVLDGAVVQGNRDYLQQMLFIFIENAFKYTSEGTVMLDIQRAGSQIGIRIADTGIGMDKEEVPHIFDRFYRADPSRGETTGTGLGLSIAKWIIDEHGGSIEVTTRKDEGSTFIVWLPVSFPLSLE